jgi:hypothetical protein
MRRLCIVIVLLGLSACSESVDYLYYLNHPRHHHRHVLKREYVPAPLEAPAPETHDEKVERVHRESAQRRKAYCDSHPNLAIRIGCDIQ